MRKTRSKRILSIAAAVFLGTIFLQVVGGLILQTILREVFSAGSGCHVELENTRLSLLPLSASTENVKIIHPNESPSAGFRAERISVRLRFLPLFLKRVILDDLLIDGASVHSFGADTGFLNTMEFLFSKERRAREEAARKSAWHDSFSQGWKIWVPLVAIETKDGGANQFILGEDMAYISGDKVYFEARDPTGEPQDPVQVVTWARGVALEGAEFLPRSLGSLEATGTIGGGVVRFTEAILSGESQGQEGKTSRTRARGALYIAGEGKYKLDWSSSLHDAYLSALIEPVVTDSRNQATLTLNGTVSGEILDPLIEANFDFKAEQFEALSLDSSCLPKQLRGVISGSKNRLSFQNVFADTLVRDGELRYEFAQSSFQTNLNIVTDEEQAFVEECFLAKVSGLESAEKRASMTQALTKAVSNSRAEFTAEGTLEPFRFLGTLSAELNRRDPSFRSKLDSKLDVTESVFSATLRERGVLPQIQPEPPSESQSSKGAPKGATRFQTATNSNADLSLSYGFDDGRLEIQKLNFTRYPLVKLLLRATPFLDHEQFAMISSEIDSQSTIDGQGKASIDFATNEATGSGNYLLQSVAVASLGIDELQLPFKVSEKGIALTAGKARMPAGEIAINMLLGHEGELSGALSFQDLKLRELPISKDYFSEFLLDMSGSFDIKGSIENPVYSAKLDLHSSSLLEGEQLRQSEIIVNGTKESLTANAVLFDTAGKIELNLPLTEDGRLSVKAEANDLPLSFLLPPAASDVVKRSSGQLTGVLNYRGERSEPLLGSGELQITKIRIDHEDLFLENPQPLIIRIKNKRLDFGTSILSINKELVSVKGYLDAETGWNASVKGTIALGEYLADLPRIEQLSGGLDVDLIVSGSPEAPSFVGFASLNDGSVSVPLEHTVIGADDIEALIEFDSKTMILRELSARIGGGVITGQGTLVNFFDETALAAALEFQVADIAIAPVENSLLRFGGPLSVKKKPTEVAKVEGELRISSALYESKISLREVLSALTSWFLPSGQARPGTSTRVSGLASDRESEGVTLDIKIVGDNGILVDTSFAQAELSADFLVRGESSAPTIRGEIAVLDGQFGFQSTQFDILAGSLLFSGESAQSDPEIEIVGESTVRTLTGEEQLVRVLVSGRLRNPVLQFTSDGGLSEREIVGLLGAGGDSGAGFSILQGKREPRTFRELISPASDLSLTDRLVGLTGFRDVQIQTKLSQSTGEFVPSVLASRPVTERVDLDIKSELAGERASEVGVTYPLTPYLELIAGWSNVSFTSDVNDSSGSYEIGVEYKKTFPGFLFWKPKELKEGRE